MATAHHDAAVQHLTDSQRFVRLVVQREIKGPLEPPQSPRSPLLKGLSPSGYLANRPTGYKRAIDGSVIGDETATRTTAQDAEIIGSVRHELQYHSAGEDGSSVATNGGGNENGGVAQPVPAPRRLNSENSSVNGVSQNGTAPTAATAAATAAAMSTNAGNKSEDDDAQV